MFKDFMYLSERLNKEGISSYNDLDLYKLSGNLDKRIECEINLNAFREDIREYLMFLFSYNGEPFYKKQLMLYKNFDLTLLFNSQYILSLYCGNLNSYRNYPLLLKSIATKLNIEPFKRIPVELYESKVQEFYFVEKEFSQQYNHPFCELLPNSCINKDKYDKYNMNGFSEDTMFAWGEIQSYNALNQKPHTYLESVGYNYGDRFGYDLYLKEPDNHEILVEVKTGRNRYFALSENEYNVMLQSFIHNAEYYIYRIFIEPTGKWRIARLRFDQNYYRFIDIDTGETYDLNENIAINGKVKEFGIIKNEKQYVYKK